MNRRAFLALAGGAAIAWPLASRAQQKAMPVIGFLHAGSSGPSAPFVAAFRQGLSETGFVEGQNVKIEFRWAEGHYDRLPAMAADLVARNVAAIATLSGTPTALIAKTATSTIPIVFFTGGDPVVEGLVASFARPGGNLTGIAVQTGELTAKRLELISELVPQAKVIALLVNPTNVSAERTIKEVEDAAHAKGLQLAILKASAEGEVDAAFEILADLHVGAMVVGSDAFFTNQRDQLVALASRYAVPAIHPTGLFAAAGGLISYGPSFAAGSRQAGGFAGRILNGDRPADLPVQQPTKFDLVINLKTAAALGLTVPQSILARADEVIE
jgi:putative ABC transport system substrate-binding protein